MAIRVELNEFKMKEMSVHNESRKNTLFYDVGKGFIFLQFSHFRRTVRAGSPGDALGAIRNWSSGQVGTIRELEFR